MHFDLKKICIIAFFASLFFSSAYAAQLAEYVPSSEGSIYIINSSQYSVEEISGSKALVIDNANVGFAIDDSICLGNDERLRAEISVTYIDDGGGSIGLIYDSFDGRKSYYDIEELYNTQNIVTRTFVIYDARFANSISNGADFILSSTDCQNYKPLKVLKVELKLCDTNCPISVSAESLSPGNIFFDGDLKNIDITYKNQSNEQKSFSVGYEITDIDNTVVSSRSETYTIGAGGNKKVSVVPAVENYGVYTFLVSLTDENGGDMGTFEYDFSVCVRVNTDEYDSMLGICPHFNWDRESEGGSYILKNIGIDYIREGYSWPEYESSKGEYEESTACTDYLNAADKNGMSVLVMAGYNNTIYGASNVYDIPSTDAQRTAFAEYVYNMLSQNKGRIHTVEVWNEPNISAFNSNNASPSEYVKLLKAVYERIKPDFPEVEISAFAVASAFDEATKEWITQALSADIDGDSQYDAYKYFDCISIHHYLTDFSRIVTGCTELKNVLAEYGSENKKIYHTEYGMSDVFRNGYGWTLRGEENQAIELVKYTTTLKANNAGDRFYIYDFSNDGKDENQSESNFGIAENHQATVPYAAKPALIALANLNKIIGDCSISEISESGNLNVYCFKDKYDVKDSYVFYASEEAVYSFVPEEGDVTFYDLYGNVIAFDATNGIYSVKLGNEPIYAIVQRPANSVATSLSDGIMTVNGKFVNGRIGEYVGTKVFNEQGELVFVSQLTLNEEKSCSFDFAADSKESYTIWFGMATLSQIYITDVEGTGTAAFTLKSSANEVDTVNKLLSNTSFEIETEIFDDSINDFVILATGYKNNTLYYVTLLTKNDMVESNGVYSAELDSSSFEGADTANFF